MCEIHILLGGGNGCGYTHGIFMIVQADTDMGHGLARQN